MGSRGAHGLSFPYRLSGSIRPWSYHLKARVQRRCGDGGECKQRWGCRRLASCCCGGAGLTTPGSSQRKPLGWAPRVCKAAWAQHREIFSRVLGRLLALPRPPGSPSISPTEWRGWVREEIYFLALEQPSSLSSTFLRAREQWGTPKQAFLGQQVCGAGRMAPARGLPALGVGHWRSLNCSLCFQNSSLRVTC